MNISKRIRKIYKENDRISFIVYFTLRMLVIFTLIRQIMLQEWENVFVCILSLFLLLAPFSS